MSHCSGHLFLITVGEYQCVMNEGLDSQKMTKPLSSD